MREALCLCKNDSCQSVIYRGDQVWTKSRKLYCSIKCAVDSLKENSPASTGLLSKAN